MSAFLEWTDKALRGVHWMHPMLRFSNWSSFGRASSRIFSGDYFSILLVKSCASNMRERRWGGMLL